MKHPACIDVLENRLNTTVEFWKHRFWHVTANCSKGIVGHGETIDEACDDLLIELGLETESLTAREFRKARGNFACETKTNKAAALLLRNALNAHGVDLIDDEELEGVIFDIIDYLESR